MIGGALYDATNGIYAQNDVWSSPGQPPPASLTRFAAWLLAHSALAVPLLLAAADGTTWTRQTDTPLPVPFVAWGSASPGVGVTRTGRSFSACETKGSGAAASIYLMGGTDSTTNNVRNEVFQFGVNGCVSWPCVNGGTCSVLNGGVYACACLPGYSGAQCQTDINECASAPCMNTAFGTVCVDLLNSFSCSCGAGFSGTFCQTGVCFVLAL